jgi:hypothetical protein
MSLQEKPLEAEVLRAPPIVVIRESLSSNGVFLMNLEKIDVATRQLARTITC